MESSHYDYSDYNELKEELPILDGLDFNFDEIGSEVYMEPDKLLKLEELQKYFDDNASLNLEEEQSDIPLTGIEMSNVELPESISSVHNEGSFENLAVPGPSGTNPWATSGASSASHGYRSQPPYILQRYIPVYGNMYVPVFRLTPTALNQVCSTDNVELSVLHPSAEYFSNNTQPITQLPVAWHIPEMVTRAERYEDVHLLHQQPVQTLPLDLSHTSRERGGILTKLQSTRIDTKCREEEVAINSLLNESLQQADFKNNVAENKIITRLIKIEPPGTVMLSLNELKSEENVNNSFPKIPGVQNSLIFNQVGVSRNGKISRESDKSIPYFQKPFSNVQEGNSNETGISKQLIAASSNSDQPKLFRPFADVINNESDEKSNTVSHELQLYPQDLSVKKIPTLLTNSAHKTKRRFQKNSVLARKSPNCQPKREGANSSRLPTRTNRSEGRGSASTGQSGVDASHGSVSTSQSGVLASRGFATTGQSWFLASSCSVSTRQSGILASRGSVSTRQSGVLASRGSASTGQSEVLASRGSVSTRQSGILASRGSVSTSQSGVLASRGSVSTSQSVVLASRGSASTGQSGVLASRCSVFTSQSGVLASRGSVSTGQSGVLASRGSVSTSQSGDFASRGSVPSVAGQSEILASLSFVSTSQSGVFGSRGSASAGSNALNKPYSQSIYDKHKHRMQTKYTDIIAPESYYIKKSKIIDVVQPNIIYELNDKAATIFKFQEVCETFKEKANIPVCKQIQKPDLGNSWHNNSHLIIQKKSQYEADLHLLSETDSSRPGKCPETHHVIKSKPSSNKNPTDINLNKKSGKKSHISNVTLKGNTSYKQRSASSAASVICSKDYMSDVDNLSNRGADKGTSLVSKRSTALVANGKEVDIRSDSISKRVVFQFNAYEDSNLLKTERVNMGVVKTYSVSKEVPLNRNLKKECEDETNPFIAPFNSDGVCSTSAVGGESPTGLEVTADAIKEEPIDEDFFIYVNPKRQRWYIMPKIEGTRKSRRTRKPPDRLFYIGKGTQF